MRLKDLEIELQNVANFEKPKIEFEQYPTTPHLAARIIYTAESSFGDIVGKRIIDLGCGCGMLSIASSLMGSASVVGVDIDADALVIAKRNAIDFDTYIDLIHADIRKLPFRRIPACDTVILNPPFGTKRNAGIDMEFLKNAIAITENAVYSLHKSSTRKHISMKAQEWHVDMEVLAEMRYDLSQSYSFHKKKCVDIEVDLLRFSKRKLRIE